MFNKMVYHSGITEDRVLEIVLERATGFDPPDGTYKVTNIFVNPATGKLTVEYDDTPIT